MKAQLQQYIAKFAALSVREKILVSSSAVTAILIGWFLLVSEPLYLGTKKSHEQAVSMQKNIAELQKQLHSLQQRKNEDPQRDLKQRIAQLDTHLAKLDVELRDKFASLEKHLGVECGRDNCRAIRK